jgi:hypothetical protein
VPIIPTKRHIIKKKKTHQRNRREELRSLFYQYKDELVNHFGEEKCRRAYGGLPKISRK